MESIELALEDLTLQDKPNISATAKKYEIERSTLSRRFNKVTTSKAVKAQRQQLLSKAQEQALCDYITKLTERGIPPTVYMVRNFAYEIANKEPSRKWSQRFLERWKNRLDARYLSHIDSVRHKADSWWSYNQYYELVKRKTQEYDVLPCNTYNMDEKGFLIGFSTKTRRIFDKSALEKDKAYAAIRDGNREWITCLATICANSTWLSPALIFKAESRNLQDT